MTLSASPRPSAPASSPWARLRATLRGALAVTALLAGALDALVAARLGIPRLAFLARRLGRVLADEYRRGRAGAIDIDVKDDTP